MLLSYPLQENTTPILLLAYQSTWIKLFLFKMAWRFYTSVFYKQRIYSLELILHTIN